MTTYKLALDADLKRVYFGYGTGLAFPAQSIALPDLVHDDALDGVHAYAPNHALWHHVRDTLYKRKASDGSAGATYPNGIYNMQEISIEPYGAAAKAVYLSAAPLSIVAAATDTIVIEYETDGVAAGVAATNADFTFESADPLVATVSTAGVVTAVAEGETIVTATEKNGTKSVEVAITVTGA